MSQALDNSKQTDESHNSEKKEVSPLKLFMLAMACYLPAFGLVLLSFLSFSLFNRSPKQDSPLSFSQREEIEKIAKQKVTEVIDNELSAALDRRQTDLEIFIPQGQSTSNDPDPILLTGYINERVQRQAQIEAEKAAIAKIEELKTDWTAGLFNQIAFAVIFTVASIFAAFAVKDVLTEILKDQEKDRIKKDLKKELEGYVTDDLMTDKIKSHTRRLTSDIEGIEVYAYWLEHELLTSRIAQLLKDTCYSRSPNIQKNESNSQVTQDSDMQDVVIFSDIEEDVVLSLKRLIGRSHQAFEKVSGSFFKSELEIFENAKRSCLKQSIQSSQLKEDSKEILLEKVDSLELVSSNKTNAPWLRKEINEKRINSLFKVQAALLVKTLGRLPGDNSELIKQLKQALFSDPRVENEKQEKDFVARMKKRKKNRF